MRKLTKYQLQKISRNLDKYFNLASEDDIKSGLLWYQQANEICKDIAQKYGTSTFIASGVISALSPRNKWAKNIQDAYTVFEAVQNNIEAVDTKVSTFHTNKFKAFAIAQGKVTITSESNKTFAFCENIAHLNEDFVTVDVWHLRACFDMTMGQIGDLAYKQLQNITLSKAKKLGMKGFEYQAIIWNSVQNNF
jgi:hypothetical protein